MDAWWTPLNEAIFGPALGEDAMKALQAMVPFDAELGPGKAPHAPAFSTGWYDEVTIRGVRH